MVNEVQYTSVRRVLDNLLEHPMMADLTLEQVVRHTIRFISLHGYNGLYQNKIADVGIEDYRGLLPCDLISIVQVKDLFSGICMRSMTDSFPTGMTPDHKHPVPPDSELTFKTQGCAIFTSFPKGTVQISYLAIPVDDDGFPLLIDNETYLAALEAYIKKQVFTVKYDTGKIASGVLQNAKQDYALLAGQLRSEFVIPSISEMESISRSLTHLIPRVRQFDNGFKNLGDREYFRNHNNRM